LARNDDPARKLRAKNLALLVTLLALVCLLYGVTYVRMTQTEQRRHETVADPHRLSPKPAPNAAPP
jgi:hypothetical protein